jgi:hypothetical protein
VIKWFEGNPLAIALASICGSLLLISLILAVIGSLPLSVSDAGGDSDEAGFVINVPELKENEPIDTYAVITERPLFNEDRLPVIEDDSAESNEEVVEEEIDAPDFELAGVIITPSIRMVTLKTKDQPVSLVAFEGQPLHGDYGTWQVSRIEPRQITLASGRGEEVQLQLQIHDMTIAAPPKPSASAGNAAPEPASQAGEGESDQPLTRAEEIRQRIAQRREELRQAAEDKDENVSDLKNEYRKELQSMLNGVQPKRKKDEN